MAIELSPIPLPASADPSKFTNFGREVKGVNPAGLSPEHFKEILEALYKVNIITPLDLAGCDVNASTTSFYSGT
jgi:hypothetical protein